MKTAVEWIEERLFLSMQEELKPLKGFFVVAKEIEKKQIADAYDISKKRYEGNGEDYYNYFINDYSE